MLNKIPQNEWIVIYVTNDFTDAHIIAGRLEVEGIKSFVHRQPGAAAFGITVGSIGEISVLVHPRDEARAEAVLYPDEPDELPDSTSEILYRFDQENDDDPVE
ncbi:MAG: DUF2007 domain-containing protein [Anaerolineae bacterium]|nr:DUF2007 domain-containing protein [Anaerolineae bacterium]